MRVYNDDHILLLNLICFPATFVHEQDVWRETVATENAVRKRGGFVTTNECSIALLCDNEHSMM